MMVTSCAIAWDKYPDINRTAKIDFFILASLIK